MSDATKKQAAEKLAPIANKIGYPDSGATTRRCRSSAGIALGNSHAGQRV